MRCKRPVGKMHFVVLFLFLNHLGSSVGQKTVPIESVPFLASLMAPRGGEFTHFCAASIIHEMFLLTAASCFEGHDTNQTKVLVGTANLKNPKQIYDIALFIPHKKYFKQTGDYNVGLVKVVNRLTLGPKVGVVEVGKRRVKVGSWVDVAGWGSMNTTAKLRRASIPVLRKSACQDGLGRIIGPRLLCAGAEGEGRGGCVVDEGGPVFKNGTLIGVGTPLSSCGRLPGLYTRVTAVRGWVTATIDDNISYLDYFDILSNIDK